MSHGDDDPIIGGVGIPQSAEHREPGPGTQDQCQKIETQAGQDEETERFGYEQRKSFVRVITQVVVVVGCDLITRHPTEHIGRPQRRHAVMGVSVILDVLTHAFPVYDIALLQHLSFQGRFAIDHGHQDEHGDGCQMGQEFLEIESLHIVGIGSWQY